MMSTSIIDGRDRLSELPDEILVHILSYLPITDAVKTVLIRRFGDLWTLVPSLNLDDAEFFKEWLYDIGSDNYIPCFASFVRNVLLLHKRTPIDKFQLLFYNIDVYDDDPFVNEITTWIRVAIGREVKQFKVQFEFEVDGSVFPRCVFTSQFLVELELVNCGIETLSHVQMESLRKLSLVDVATDNVVIKRLICGSPSLQELVLNNVIGVNKLQFTALNIKKLDIGLYHGLLDCPNLKFLNIFSRSPSFFPLQEVVMVDVSSVSEVNIGSCYLLDEFVESVKKLLNARIFKFSDKRLQSSMSKELVIPQTRWKRIHIETQLQADQLLGLCKVLSSSPLLEELITYTDQHDLVTAHDHNMHSLELPSSCSVQRLKTVTMRGYKVPCQGLLQIAEYLLKSSVSLDKMVIMPSENQVEALEEAKFVKQLLSFPRASTNARVIFGSDIY